MAASTSSESSNNCNNNLRVLLRVRPLTNRERLEPKNRNVLEVVGEDSIMLHGKRSQCSSKEIPKCFNFDRVFGPEVTTLEIYSNSIQTLIASLMDGFNCSVFAYGATGAGKTHTMLGSPSEPGITSLLVEDLYTTMIQRSIDVDVEVSYLEVYNEQVHDLLVQQNPATSLQLQDDGDANVVVKGLSWHRPVTVAALMNILHEGNKRRTQHPTDANQESSRSHAMFEMRIKVTKKCEGGENVGQPIFAKLSMVDLAGSERGPAAAVNPTIRTQEGANINRSLLALGSCITALAGNMKHVPYRNSKLTRLLQESLGGNCRSIMVANVSPSSVVYEDSVNTLRYATGARKIKSNLEKNLVAVDATAAEMAKELEGVQVELRRVKEEYAQLSAQDAARLQEIEALKETVTKLTQQKAETAAKLDKFQTAFTKRFKKLGSDFTEVGLWVIDKFDDLDSGVTTSVDSPDTPSIAVGTKRRRDEDEDVPSTSSEKKPRHF